MADRFLKFIPSTAAMNFAIKYKNAFILLLIIAESARRTADSYDGLTIGQCYLGGHKNYGMTEKEYRYAKQILVREGLIKIIATNRKEKIREQTQTPQNGQNGATGRATNLTTSSTIVELCNSDIWDINSVDQKNNKGDLNGDLGATSGRPRGDKQERRKKNEEREEEEDTYAQSAESAQSAAPPRTRKKNQDLLSFDFDSWKFTGITEADLDAWKNMYPHVSLEVEILKAAQWLRNNPSKAKKSLWRKYLTGWLGRANDTIENKKAYKDASKITLQDKRTKNMDGTPIESRAEGMF